MFHTTFRVVKLVLAFCITTTLVGCASTTMPQPTSMPKSAEQMANPASENCSKQGGTLAAQYCAITGGTYQVTGNSNTEQEQGTCTFKNGQTCDAGDYFAGKCNPNTETGQLSYNDPFAYCAAVGTIDTPDARYKGDKMPASIVRGMIQQGMVAADAPQEFQKNAIWRCMNKRVWVCHFGANIPCLEKANTAQALTAEMEEYCKTNPTADSIPAFVTGRATVYEWRCKGGKAEVVKQLFKSDPQGYLADFWYELTPK